MTADPGRHGGPGVAAMSGDELLAREWQRIKGLLEETAQALKRARSRAPVPLTAREAASHLDRAARALKLSATAAGEAGGSATASAWALATIAAMEVGVAAGITLEYTRRSAGNAIRKATPRSRVLDELAAEAGSAYGIGQRAEVRGIEPESVARAVNRRRKRIKTK